MTPPFPKKDWGLQFMKCFYQHGLGFPPLPLVLSQGSDPSGLRLSYNTIVAVTHSAINASRALVSKTSGMSGPGPALHSFVCFRLTMLGFHRVGLVRLITYNRAQTVRVHCYETS